MGQCWIHQVTFQGERCPACEAAEDRQRLIDRALRAEAEVGRLNEQIRTARGALEILQKYAQTCREMLDD